MKEKRRNTFRINKIKTPLNREIISVLNQML